MGVVYSLYDALVNINVPDEKAKAVIDALEREMMDKLATKADLANLLAATHADIANLRSSTEVEISSLRAITKVELTGVRELISKDLEMVRSEMQHLRMDLAGKLDKLKSDTTITVGSMMAASVVLTCTILGTILALR